MNKLPLVTNQFLPDLCRLPVVLAVLLVTELVVIIYVLSTSRLGGYNWEQLSLLSLYAQWIGILSTVGLCHLRPIINRLSPRASSGICFTWIMLVTLATNTGAQWIFHSGDWRQWTGLWLSRDLIIVGVLAAICLRYMYVQQGWRLEQRATQNAKVDALHARIRPHFLFNSMNTIASLISYAPEEAERAVEDLAALFRASLSQSDVLVSWQQELSICQAYLRIEQQRLGERLVVDWQLSKVPDDFQLPPLTLQPLIENAIYHGIERRPETGVLLIKSEISNGLLHISVQNPLAPISNSSAIPEATLAHGGGAEAPSDDNRNGIALDNIQARLTAIYRDPVTAEDRATLILSSDTEHFTARLTFPEKSEGLFFGSEQGEVSI